MKRLCWLLLWLMPACCLVANAQEKGRGCGTTQAHQELLQRNPAYAQKMQEAETAARKAAATRPGQNLRTQQEPDTITVVFHVLYRTPQENISDAQLLSQLTVLNEDFNRLNADAANTPDAFKGIAGNPRLYFCLATLDPDGNPSTGITRRQTDQPNYSMTGENMKFTARSGTDAWNPELYLNIWVCNLGNDILGYAQFPGGPPATDGIVLKYSSVGRPPFNPFPGSYNLGRTATHEIGHWLGLRHIWGEGESSCTDSDFIDDTPNQSAKSTGCPAYPQLSCNNGPAGNMFMNFMDYTNDNCMNLFSQGQADEMYGVLHTTRQSLLHSNMCSNVLHADFRAIPDAVLPGNATNFYYYSNGRRPDSFFWTFEGATPASSTEKDPAQIRYDTPGAYTVTLTVKQGNEEATETKKGYLKVTTSNLQAYPNPADREITLAAPAGQELMSVSVYNTLGKLLFTATATQRTFTFDTQDFANGLYLMRGITTYGNSLSKQVLVLHGKGR